MKARTGSSMNGKLYGSGPDPFPEGRLRETTTASKLELMAQQLELRYSPMSSNLFAGILWGCGLKETKTSKYTASRARHVIFPSVFPIGLYGAFDTLFIILLVEVLHPCK